MNDPTPQAVSPATDEEIEEMRADANDPQFEWNESFARLIARIDAIKASEAALRAENERLRGLMPEWPYELEEPIDLNTGATKGDNRG